MQITLYFGKSNELCQNHLNEIRINRNCYGLCISEVHILVFATNGSQVTAGVQFEVV